MKKLEE
jgi:hypothetical protein